MLIEHIMKYCLAALAFLVIGSASAGTPLRSLQPAFDTKAIRAAHGIPNATSFTCPAVPSAQVNVGVGSKYKPGTGSTVLDPKGAKALAKLNAKLKKFTNPLATMANDYVRSSPADGRIARCVVFWLASWGRGQAAYLPLDREGEAVRAQLLAAAAMAFVQVADDPSVTLVDRNAARAWLRKLAKRVLSDYSNFQDLPTRHNNHRYWAGWSVMAASIALNDRSLFDWAVQSARIGLESVDSGGFLPLELERRQLALGYHFYALEPLVLLADTAGRNGVNLYGLNSNALLRLAKRSLSGFDFPAPFRSRTGFDQARDFAKSGGKVGWILVLGRRYPAFDISVWRKRYKKFDSVTAGGNMRLLYGNW